MVRISRWFRRQPALTRVVVLFVGLVLPQALLGLPIAATAIGPLPTLGVVLLVGAAMTIAAAAEAEALVRDGAFRREGGFFGRVVERFLGPRAAAIPDALAGLRTSMSVLASYVGLSVTLAALTGLPRVLWGAVTFVALTALLVRGGLRIPAEVGAVLGIACLPLLLAIGVIAAVHGGGDLSAADHLSGASVGNVLGVVVMLYIANVYVVQIARELLPEEPGGRALVRGSALGTVAVTVIAGAWLMATSAGLAPDQLRGEIGTVLGPLAAETGAVVVVLGTMLTLLLLGLGIERTSVAVMNLVAERLSAGRRVAVLAPLAVCALGEILLGAGSVTFSDVFGVAGIATNIVLAIAVPLLLLLAARASGDEQPEPGARVPLFGRPGAVWASVAVAAVLLVAFATVLADRLLLRIAAGASLVALLATVALAVRAGAFVASASAGGRDRRSA
jgi:hypothetical protein